MMPSQGQSVSPEERFFDLIESQARIMAEGVHRLAAALEDPSDLRAARDEMKEIEHRGDEAAHAVFKELNVTMLLPQAHDALSALAAALDDVLDYAYATANHLHLYEVERVPDELKDIGGVLQEQATTLLEIVRGLRDPARWDALHEKIVRVHALENKADDLTNIGKAALFGLDDVRELMKLKDIYEYAETATDKCEDAADMLRHILVKRG